MKKKQLIFIVFILVFIFSGCLQRSRIADLTVMSSKNISTLEGAQEIGVFEGKDCRTAMGGQMPSMEEALDMACEQGGGNAMVNAVIYFKPANCAFDNHCYEVKGTVVKTKDMFDIQGVLEENADDISALYIRESFESLEGREYLGFRKKSSVELDNDKKHYEFIVRIK
jgi:hypothetical protein